MEHIINEIIFTDGAASSNGKPGAMAGYGVYIINPDIADISMPVDKIKHSQTNQVSELLAIYHGIRQIVNYHEKNKNHNIGKLKLVIYTDSQYAINSLTKWIINWKQNNWMNTKRKPVIHKELIQDIDNMSNNMSIEYRHVRSHQKKPTDVDSHEYFVWFGNNEADKLAVAGIDN